jgi:hypothetical protein
MIECFTRMPFGAGVERPFAPRPAAAVPAGGRTVAEAG